MNQKTYSQVLEDVAHDGIPAGLDLAPQIIARIQKGKDSTMPPRIKVFVTTTSVLFVLAALLMNVPLVAAAIQRWVGYVPGFGLVRSGQFRELAEPVSVIQNGFTLRVEKAILSSEKTQVMYSLDGMTANMQSIEPTCIHENSSPFLRLPDGRKIEQVGLMGGVNPYEADFASMPADVNEATLVLNCVFNTLPDKVPQRWEVPLRFVAASPALTVVSILEAPTTPPVVPRDGLVLKNVVPTQNGYILSGTIMVVPPAGYTVAPIFGCQYDVTITDANGKELKFGDPPIEFSNDVQPDALPENTYLWACQVYGEKIQLPLTMTINSLTMSGPPLPQAEFQFDAGPDPKANQVWKLDRDVTLGAKTVHFISVRRVKGEHGMSGYEFTYVNDPALAFWPEEIKGYQRAMGGGGGGGGLNNGVIIRFLAYPEPVPTGVLTVLVNGNELLKLPGPWQVTWQP